MTVDDVEARLWEISENLHRNEMSSLEGAEQVAEWASLAARPREDVSAQVAPKPISTASRGAAISRFCLDGLATRAAHEGSS
jgi:hypothetical protein